MVSGRSELQIHLLRASNEIEAAFATLLEARAGGLIVGIAIFITCRSEQLPCGAHVTNFASSPRPVV
jgi:hypothetical protein